MLRNGLLPIALIGSLFLAAGCSSQRYSASLQFRSIDTSHLFTERFSHAYFSQSDDGDRTVVLIDEGLPRTSSSPNGPLQPLKTIPLIQVVRFKILWNPLHGTRIDAPSTTNCIIDWVIRENGPQPTTDTLRYQGAGFVTAYGGPDSLTIKIRNSTLAAASHSGDLQDPLGRCEMTGSFTADRNDELVASTASRMDQIAFANQPTP